MSDSYSNFPHKPTIQVDPFTVSIPQSDLDDLKVILKHTRIPKETFENSQTHPEDYGVTREWFIKAREAWLEFDWRKVETRINEQPNYTAKVNVDGIDHTVHFMGLFSEREDAVPIIFCNGWPSCFLEFLPLIELVRKQYSPKDLPYHLIVPSLPGYAFSSKPPLDKDFGMGDIAKVYGNMMKGLGFTAYIAQGSDVGGMVIDYISTLFDECKMTHCTNRYIASPPEGTPEYDQLVKSGGPKARDVLRGVMPFAYALEQGTKPSTMGLAMGCNPMSMLAWNGEKQLLISHPKLDMDTVLAFASLWWFTDTYPSSIYPYRQFMGAKMGEPKPKPVKPMGFSRFPYDIGSSSIEWVKKSVNLVWSREHKDGGHFPFLEHPADTWEGFEDFVDKVWKAESGANPKL